PILLSRQSAQMSAPMAPVAVSPMAPAATREPAATAVAAAAAAATAPPVASDTTATTTAVASATHDLAPAARARGVSFASRAVTPWPADAPTPIAAPAGDADTRLAAVSATVDPVETVPMPRRRPSRLIAARLAIPLPRPRPDIAIEPDAAPTRPSMFDLQ